jgi:hypothetical protein
VSPSGDDRSEMPRPEPFDDDAIDALLAGTPLAGSAAVGAFVDDLRAAAGAVPTPTPALAAAIAAGGISTYPPPVAKWRKFRMKIQGFVAGLGVAGKLALGVGVAAAATTGAGAAGVLPGPVQHAVSNAVGAITPFSFPDPEHHGASGEDQAFGDVTTTTTVGDVTTTTQPAGKGDGQGNDRNGDGNGVVTPTTGDHNATGDSTTTTVAHDGAGSNGGSGDGHDATPTTVPHPDGDNNNPESLTIHCERSADPAHIACSWSASNSAAHAHYVLLRTGDGYGRVLLESADALRFVDTSVVAGNGYGYRVDSLRADGTVESHSPLFTIECCGDAPTSTTTEHHDATPTTTVPQGDGTTTTTEHL